MLSEPDDVEEEVKHVKKVLTVNGYKKKGREEDNKTEGPTASKHLVCIHYISGL